MVGAGGTGMDAKFMGEEEETMGETLAERAKAIGGELDDTGRET